MKGWNSIYSLPWTWLNDRFDLQPLLEKNLTKKQIPKDISYLSCFGGLSLFAFLILAVTGIFLMFYYKPTPEEAYASVLFIKHNIPMGWLIQRAHSVSANVMIVLVMVHMARVFYKRVYQNPRELHWISGVFLLIFTFFMGFTGYILPWSQTGFWAATIGTEIPSAIPWIGEIMVEWVRGGKQINEISLIRFYAIHVALLPLSLAAFMGLHFTMIRRTGIAENL